MARRSVERMQQTVPIPLSRVVEQIPDGARVLVLGCGDCATREHFGGAAECAAMAEALEAEGITVVGRAVPPDGEGTCDPRVARAALQSVSDAVEQADLIVLLACPQGEAAVERASDLPVLLATQVIVGGETGGGQTAVEDCNFCAQCVARAAGGLCPHSFCPKHLINGPCGGAQGGRCEVLPKRPCVWELIHRRLKATGQLEILRAYREPVSFRPAGVEDADETQ